jgi:hypothetical protein
MNSRWSSSLPTLPGIYWLRVKGEFDSEVVQVSECEGTLKAYLCGCGQPVPLEGPGHEWHGPLIPPS